MATTARVSAIQAVPAQENRPEGNAAGHHRRRRAPLRQAVVRHARNLLAVYQALLQVSDGKATLSQNIDYLQRGAVLR